MLVASNLADAGTGCILQVRAVLEQVVAAVALTDPNHGDLPWGRPEPTSASLGKGVGNLPPVLPTPPEDPDVTWRPATLGDAEALARLQAACYQVDGGYLMVAEEFRTEIGDENDDPARDTLIAATGDGAIVVFGALHVPGGEETERRCFSWGHVHPGFRRRGLGTFLMQWMEARAAQRFAAHDDGLPTVIRVSAYDTQADRIALFDRCGYVPVRYFSEMIRDLAAPTPTGDPPGRIEIRPWSDEHSEATRAVHNAAFADHWGSQPITEYSWKRWRDEFFLPDASFIAFDGNRVVAYLVSQMYPHDFASRGRTEAWIEGLGTVGSHRGRGIASALLIAAMTAYRSPRRPTPSREDEPGPSRPALQGAPEPEGDLAQLGGVLLDEQLIAQVVDRCLRQRPAQWCLHSRVRPGGDPGEATGNRLQAGVARHGHQQRLSRHGERAVERQGE